MKFQRSTANKAKDAQGAFYDGVSFIRVDTKVWKYMLLENMDKFTFNGVVKVLTGKSLGAGVYELTMKNKEYK